LANEYLNNRTFESIIQAYQHHKRQKRKFELVVEDLQQTHDRRRIKYEDDYRRDALEAARRDYELCSSAFEEYKEQLAYAFYILSKNIANWAKFSGIDIDDAIQEGVLICFEKVDRFNPNYRGKSGQKAKAFNYMSTCILNHYRQLYRSARNYNELKKRYHTFLQERFESVFIRNGKEKTAVGKSGIDSESSLW
jgi:predicted RNase H-like nuclease (RuvC/YqgF family)